MPAPPRPHRRTPSRGSRTSPERGGLTGHAPEPGPAPWEPSACTRRAGGSPSRGAALRRPLSPKRWPACAGREPGWLPSPPTVRLAGGRARRGGRARAGTLGNLRGSAVSAGLPGREPNPRAKGCTSAAQRGCLGTGKGVCVSMVRGTPEGSYWGASGLQKNSTRSGVLTSNAGCQLLFRVSALDLGNMRSLRGCSCPCLTLDKLFKLSCSSMSPSVKSEARTSLTDAVKLK